MRQALTTWFADHIQLQTVDTAPGPGGDYSQIQVTIGYLLIETQSLAQTQVVVS